MAVVIDTVPYRRLRGFMDNLMSGPLLDPGRRNEPPREIDLVD